MHILIWPLLFLSLNAWSFPDTVRRGYTSCTTCHVSPGGGGLLTDYGRNLSKELMSTWGTTNEEQPLHGLFNMKKPKLLERLVVGGDARYITRRQTSETSKIDEGFWMQVQARAGLLFEKVKIVTTWGSIENPRESTKIQVVSPEYYAILTPKEPLSIRVGRFEPMYGLRLPDHNLWVKSETGFHPWMQRDTIEFIHEDEKQMLTLGGFQSISKMPVGQQTTGYNFNFYQILGDHQRVGISALNAEGQGQRQRTLTGHGTLSFRKIFFTHLELTRVWNSGATKDVTFLRSGLEVAKGFIPFIQLQSKVDRDLAGDGQYKYGAGIQWLPRPHFEIVFQIEQLSSRQGDSQENFLLFHYYL